MASRKKLPCAWCGKPYVDRAHVPTKFLIPKEDLVKYQQNVIVLPACEDCNQGFSLDESWFVTHHASSLIDFSPTAAKIFNGPVSKHLQKQPSLARRYMKQMELVELRINGQSQGVKTKIELSDEDWHRLLRVAEMFARGLYYHHRGATAQHLEAKVVSLTPKLYREKYQSIATGLSVHQPFPGSFEYLYGHVPETSEAIFVIGIYGKPAYIVLLVQPEKAKKENYRVKWSYLKKKKEPNIEILG